MFSEKTSAGPVRWSHKTCNRVLRRQQVGDGLFQVGQLRRRRCRQRRWRRFEPAHRVHSRCRQNSALVGQNWNIETLLVVGSNPKWVDTLFFHSTFQTAYLFPCSPIEGTARIFPTTLCCCQDMNPRQSESGTSLSDLWKDALPTELP